MSVARVKLGPPAGLPGPLPEGERLLWQGRPDWRALARAVFHVRGMSIYLAAVFAWCLYGVWQDGGGALDIARYAGLAVAPVALAFAYAWLTSRGVTYTITDQRVVLRIGIVLPLTINLPYSRIETAAMTVRADGTGTISLLLTPGEKLAYLLLWPHARPWRLARPEPSLRSVPDAARVGQILARALAASAEMPAPVAVPVQTTQHEQSAVLA